MTQSEPIGLPPAEAAIWSALATEPLAIDTLASRVRLTTRECLMIVTSLEIKGMVECLLTGEVRRR